MHAEAELSRPAAADVAAALRAQLERVIAEVHALSTDGSIAANQPVDSELPPPLEQLLVRLRYLYPAELATRQVVELGELSIDLIGQEVRVAGRATHLTRREFGVLRLLVRERDRALSREQILEQVWGDCVMSSQRTVDIHIHRLRTKLGQSFSERLQTLRNVGYKLRREPLSRHGEHLAPQQVHSA